MGRARGAKRLRFLPSFRERAPRGASLPTGPRPSRRGTIEAASRGTGQGTTFAVTLPLQLGATSADAPSLPAELSGLRLFLVDDDDDAREAMSVLLRQCGASVTAFASAAEAFEALQAGPPDVLLSDIAMPGEDGYSLIRRVRALPPQRGGRVRAAALTAYAGAEDRARALAAGYNEHLAKPVEPKSLVGAAARLGRGHASEDLAHERL